MTIPLHDVPGDRIPFIEVGKTEHVQALYTFVYENRDGEWLIAHRHSSLIS